VVVTKDNLKTYRQQARKLDAAVVADLKKKYLTPPR